MVRRSQAHNDLAHADIQNTTKMVELIDQIMTKDVVKQRI